MIWHWVPNSHWKLLSSALPIPFYALPEICKMNGNFDLLCDFRHLDPVDKSRHDFIRQRQFRGTQYYNNGPIGEQSIWMFHFAYLLFVNIVVTFVIHISFVTLQLWHKASPVPGQSSRAPGLGRGFWNILSKNTYIYLKFQDFSRVAWGWQGS